jgi:hypothetical protein
LCSSFAFSGVEAGGMDVELSDVFISMPLEVQIDINKI